jgi:hypothetical protein
MSGGDDWAPGDLALRCGDGEWFEGDDGGATIGPAPGSINTVSWAGWTTDAVGELFALRFVEWPAQDAVFDAAAFRKIRPHTPDAEDAETIRLLTGKPVKVGA